MKHLTAWAVYFLVVMNLIYFLTGIGGIERGLEYYLSPGLAESLSALPILAFFPVFLGLTPLSIFEILNIGQEPHSLLPFFLGVIAITLSSMSFIALFKVMKNEKWLYVWYFIEVLILLGFLGNILALDSFDGVATGIVLYNVPFSGMYLFVFTGAITLIKKALKNGTFNEVGFRWK